MRAAINHIYKKHWYYFLILLVAFIGIKTLSAGSLGRPGVAKTELDTWVSDCEDMDGSEIEVYLSELQDTYYSSQYTSSEAIREVSEFSHSFQNMKSVTQLMEFSEAKEGSLPKSLPANYMELLDFYKELKSPSVINESKLDIYFELQKFSMVVVFVVLLSAFFFGRHYETDVYKFADTTKYGRKYNRAIRGSVLSISCLVLLLNELFDLLYSGLLLNRNILMASLQSYQTFANTQINGCIWQVLVLMMVSKLAGVLLVCQCVELFVRWRKNTKDTLVLSFCGLLLFYFVSKSLADTGVGAIVQVGLLDWQAMIGKSVLLLPVQVTALEIGCVVMCMSVAGVFVNRLVWRRKRLWR